MNNSNEQFFGRAKALNWLRRQVFDTGKGPGPSPILLVHGGEGLGKATLVEQFLKEYTGSDGGYDTVNFLWKANVRIPSVGSFAQMLLHSGSTALSDLQGNDELLELELKEPLANNDPGTGAGMGNTYRIDGSSREKGIQPGNPDGVEDSYLANLFISKLVKWLKEGHHGGGSELETLLRLIFVFESFESYPTPIKSWLGRYLFPALEEDPQVPPMSVILTGTLPWHDSGQADYWQAHPGSFHQFALDPLSRQECEEWLRRDGIKMSLLDLIYEETEGFPARILQAIQDKDWLDKKKESSTDSDNPLSRFNAQERRWLHAAAMENGLTLESLQLMLGRVEGTQAFGWLSRHIDFCQVEMDPRNEHILVLSGDMRKTVLRKMTPKVPARHREFLGKVDLMKKLQGKVESAEHRGHLRVLTPLQPFSKDLIKEVFSDES